MASTTGTANAAPAGLADQPGSVRPSNGQHQRAAPKPKGMQLIHFPSPILASVPAPTTIPHVPGKRRRISKFNLTGLSDDVFYMLVKEHLSVFDRASLALVCKSFAAKITLLPSLLRIRASDPEYDTEEETKFFRNRIQQFFPGHLKYCQICGTYLPIATKYWKESLHREYDGRPGMLARNFAAWTAGKTKGDTMAYHYRQWKETNQCRTCPRCKLHSRHF